MVNIEHYTYRITWSAEDDEFVGLCAEFPSLSWLAKERVEALAGITALVADILRDIQANGETPPQPLAEKHYSGKLVLRLPPEQHRRLAINASEEGVSLNRYLCARLAV
ncbi:MULTISPECIES: type II toxin-antitoxin system HicB family antitoxin [Yersinia]|jgi:predicted HicB family RNase H-like nuclease|uniref:Toxin-antitoxin system HicB family antitoxin n=1 Tax=Yersinia intermedia TaxID=631 RepID=A0A208ZWW6_YERIN|nr:MULTISPECIES: type II toxin-antitoxin system HicB family antitoxin [Yersinia]AJJ19249.1 hicB family protein [Yersinia intermedia]ARB83328.1 type II toxin-antitoxin system HicB family antitoxin [Yersinia sp. FDAARGOS_228]AVL37086.1 type II toxin-antitoxin system HicB family antitoxin [Yersinia intermedia]MCB5300266.1 type II toxin-antitoxin system HicB family antitoxin [Yersinia intermedia]MCB5313286.1 type II toxin-antitoxin system HicB family antitoxin [Yersinia intermedia]